MDRNGRSAWIRRAGLGILILNSGLAIYRSRADASVVFVLASYAALVLLFSCLAAFDRAAPGSAARGRRGRAVWALTAMFAWKVAALMPVPVAAVVWALAVATSLGGFLTIFVNT
uniref:Uncharacterized protein n=1 Tax=Oryza brachyantha TaxID=4533 RepID=J3MB93_ORYBR